MATTDPFVGNWRIKSVGPKSRDFAEGTILSITLTAEEKKYNVEWIDHSNGNSWHITDLPLVDDENALKSPSIAVWSLQDAEEGNGRELSYPRQVKLWLQGKELGGDVALLPHHSLGDGPVGTFIAEASGGNEGLDAPRLEESIAV